MTHAYVDATFTHVRIHPYLDTCIDLHQRARNHLPTITPTYMQDDYVRVDLNELSKVQVCSRDSPALAGQSSTVSFQKILFNH